jgi:hypothetical protein
LSLKIFGNRTLANNVQAIKVAIAEKIDFFMIWGVVIG